MSVVSSTLKDQKYSNAENLLKFVNNFIYLENRNKDFIFKNEDKRIYIQIKA